jgi:hypothetical protein
MKNEWNWMGDGVPSKNIREVSLTSRHEIISVLTKEPITESVFGDTVENPMDFKSMEKSAYHFLHECVWAGVKKINLYITGLTPATTSFLNSYIRASFPIEISLYHFDRESSSYLEQKIY